MSRSVDPTELLMDLGFGGPAINSLARIPSRFFTKSHVSYIPNNIGREYLMSFYLKVLVLLLSYWVHWESPGQHIAQKRLAR